MHPLCRLATSAGDPCVYGVLDTRDKWELTNGRIIQALRVNGAGSGLIKVVGHVKQGDLLETSNVPGVAWRHSGQNPAAVVAKAREDTANDGAVHLIRCTLLAG